MSIFSSMQSILPSTEGSNKSILQGTEVCKLLNLISTYWNLPFDSSLTDDQN